ncbi:hypothetical protein [Methanosphaera cuniculi]|uniref:Uncharacterized protein n=3 Tax=Methanosphaera TaxID=2316 RepID=A0A2V2BRK5_9EURY|nr:hypothetical protein [Methanosphaera cuniculi]PWL08619.1 hypothetical protein MSCUN_03320 [Methanosphaera cuniculi]
MFRLISYGIDYMNKKAIISCIIIVLAIIALFYINSINKADAEIPLINYNLQQGNKNYNEITDNINQQKYQEASDKINNTMTYYENARYSTQKALNKTIKENDSILTEYFKHTTEEIDLKIQSLEEIQKGIGDVNSNNLQSSKEHFKKSNQLIQNTSQYTIERNNLEKQHLDKFIS